MVVVVRKKGDPDFVRVFGDVTKALEWVGPEYNKKGWILDCFEKKTETYFESMTADGMALDKTEKGKELNDTREDLNDDGSPWGRTEEDE